MPPPYLSFWPSYMQEYYGCFIESIEYARHKEGRKEKRTILTRVNRIQRS